MQVRIMFAGEIVVAYLGVDSSFSPCYFTTVLLVAARDVKTCHRVALVLIRDSVTRWRHSSRIQE
jgi:hypothetical protein